LNTQAKKLRDIKTQNKNLKSKILAITSGKGGVGKSTIASNLSFVLSSRGFKVAIFDASIGLANLDIIFNVKIKSNLLNVLKGECTLEDIIIEVEKNLFLIPGESGDEILNFYNEDIYSRVLENSEFLNTLDYLIIDTGSGIGKNVQTFLQHADEVIVVTIPDPSAITDAYALIKITSAINQNINLIVNMAENQKEGEFIYEKIQKVAKSNIETQFFLNYLGYICTSRDISKSLKFRQLFSKTRPNSLPSFHLNEIVDTLVFQLENQAPIKKNKKSFGLFIKKLIENI